MDYEKMLEEGLSVLPEVESSDSRFEIPKVKGHIQGTKTVISNIFDIAKTLERKPEHIIKYLNKELATPGEIKGQALILGTKKSSVMINEKIQKYADEFVFCQDCGKPDTKLINEGPAVYLKCLACGAKHVVKSKI